MNNNVVMDKFRIGGGKNQSVVLMKFFATLLITWSHLGMMFPDEWKGLVTGGAIGDGLFFFCSGYTLFLGRDDGFFNWYKRRINRIYSTIIVWALISSLIFGWKVMVIDIVATPKYWFISCIMVYYVLFYAIRRCFADKLLMISVFAFVGILIANFIILDRTQSVMYAQVSFMRVYYFSFMLLGAIVGMNGQSDGLVKPSAKTEFAKVMVCLVLYYACMAMYKLGSIWCQFQLFSLIPLLGTIYYLFRWCSTEWMLGVMSTKYIGALITLVSSITLEIYLVQYALYTDKYNSTWPLNIVVVLMAIVLLAYLVKCASRIFRQIFSEHPIDYKKIFKIQ